jgi:hypothetical protein
MSQNTETRVFILGAGCSAECGYPLGAGFKRALRQFHSQISENSKDCPAIRQSVGDTIALMERLPYIQTLDQLARHIDEELESWRRQRNWQADSEDCQRASLAEKQVLDAKIATSAMFLALEENVPQVGLAKYDTFIVSILGGEAKTLDDVFSGADCHVLSFNYDRMFEIAFLTRFKQYNPCQFGLYSGKVLNSGVDAKPVCDRFSFLKLHGSAGGWVKKEQPSGQERRYGLSTFKAPISLQSIEAMVAKAHDYHEWKPLIAFPHERQVAREFYQENESSSGRHWSPYIDAVWNHAGDLLGKATEVKVIGYSFDPNDSRYMIEELLGKVPASVKLVIVNTKVAEVRANVGSYKMLRGRVEFDPSPFGMFLRP